MGQVTDLKVLLAKIEGVAGTDAVPDGANNAIVIKDDVQVTHDLMTVQRGNAKGWLGRDQELVYGKKLLVRFSVEAAGSGAAGTVPKWGVLMRAAGFTENTLAAAEAGTAQAGAASTITLRAAASAVDNIYRYCQIRITGGTGAGQTRVIKGYVGAGKIATVYKAWTTPPDATSVYSIDAQVVYNPANTASSVTIYFYFSGKLHKLLMARGNVSVSQKAGEQRLMSFDFTGLYGGITDAAFPAVTVTGWTDPIVVNFVNTAKSELHGYTGFSYDFNYDLGNKIVYRNVPGVEDILFTDREPSGSIEIEDPLIAGKDFPAIVNANTLGDVLTQHGTVAGNVVGDYMPNVSLKSAGYGDQDGQVSVKYNLVITPTYGTGNDEILIYAK